MAVGLTLFLHEKIELAFTSVVSEYILDIVENNSAVLKVTLIKP